MGKFFLFVVVLAALLMVAETTGLGATTQDGVLGFLIIALGLTYMILRALDRA
jgi:hypothetical protein